MDGCGCKLLFFALCSAWGFLSLGSWRPRRKVVTNFFVGVHLQEVLLGTGAKDTLGATMSDVERRR